jgi:hypothetical protein
MESRNGEGAAECERRGEGANGNWSWAYDGGVEMMILYSYRGGDVEGVVEK